MPSLAPRQPARIATAALFALALVAASVAGCDSPPPPALPVADTNVKATPLSSIDDVKNQPAGVYAVPAYVANIQGCEPCRGPDPCSPCGPTGLMLVDRVGAPGGLLLPTLDLAAFRRGTRYLFTIAVESADSGRSPLFLMGAKPIAP